MDFGGIIRKAWSITWRYRALWVLGFFAGAGSSGGSGWGSGYSGDDLPQGLDVSAREAVRWLESNLALIVAIVVFFVVLGIAWWVLSIAARGGLVHLVDEAEEGRPVRLGAGWAAGFRNWFRVFVINLVLGVPMFLLVVLVIAVAVGPLVLSAIGGGEPGGAAIGGFCGGLAIGIPLLIAAGLIVSVLESLGIRYAVLENRGPIDALKAAWGALRSRFKDVALMWLIVFALSIAAGIAVAIPFVALAVLGVFIGIAQAWPLLIGVILSGVVVAVLFAAIWGTFESSLWTVFFRRLTGREALAPAYPATPTPGHPTSASPAPPAPTPEPPAPPAPAPAPPAPPGPPVSGG